jgi:hypothetical protein
VRGLARLELPPERVKKTELIKMEASSPAVADQYPDWLLSERGTVRKAINLEF